MAELEQGLEELKVVKQAFKDNISANNVSTSNVEFRNMPDLLKQMEKKLPTQTKSVEPTKYPQIVKADDGYKLEAVGVREIPSQYIIPTGTKEITENNEYDVTQYSKVKVEVANAGTGTGGNPKFSQLIDGTIESVEETDLVDVATIKDYTFYGCKSLANVFIPSNISHIGVNAFKDCSNINTLVLSEGITTIGINAFDGINVSEINIPTSLNIIQGGVFANNLSLTAITIPSNVIEIQDGAFGGCDNLTEITMESLTPIPVTENTFPANVTAIYVKYGVYDDYVNMWTNYVDKLVRLPAIPSTITVTVNNYLGELVNGAVVTIDGNGQTFTGTTDTSGVFVQGDLQPATYTITIAEIDGFKTPEPQEVIVAENTQNNVMFTYLEKPAILPFAESSAEQISAISAEISAQNMTSAQVAETYGWNVGDTHDITLTSGETIQVRILGFNHDNKSDGSGKAGITLQMVECLATRYHMNSTNTNAGGYATSVMKTSTLPTIKALLPKEWQDVIKLVDKKSANGGSTNYSETLTLSEDLFLLCTKEVFGTGANAQDGENEGSWYEYYETNNTADARIKKYDTTADGVAATATHWCLRSCNSSSTSGFRSVSNSGYSNAGNASNSRGVAFGFCI